MFWRNIMPPSAFLPWRMRHHIPSKWQHSKNLHGVLIRLTTILNCKTQKHQTSVFHITCALNQDWSTSFLRRAAQFVRAPKGRTCVYVCRNGEGGVNELELLYCVLRVWILYSDVSEPFVSIISIGGVSSKNYRDEIVGIFIRVKVWLENSLSQSEGRSDVEGVEKQAVEGKGFKWRSVLRMWGRNGVVLE
jgi:hypothetical protein